jgi:tetratricopeptide (TPR) repeat protein
MFFKPEPRYLDAEIALIGANELYDRDYTVYYVLSYMQQLRWESFGLSSKEEVLKKAITVNPAGFDSYINLGRSYLELSKAHDYRAKLAMEHYGMAQQLRPADFEAIIGMVTACDYIGLYDRALRLLEFAEKLYPAKADVYYNLGVVTYHIGNSYKPKKKPKEEREQYQIAEAYFKKAIQLKPSHGYAYLYLAKIYAEFKNNEQAIESLRMVMKLLDREDRYREEARRKLNEFFPDVEG